MAKVQKGFLPIADDDSRIDVTLEEGFAVIRLSTWTDGLGWNIQKTIRLPEHMLADFHNMISAARIAVRRNGGEEDLAGSTVINFPG